MEFFAIQLVGAALSFIGVTCAAALPLPGYHWYNRLAVVVLMGPCVCLVVLVDLAAHPPVNPLGFALVSLGLGLPMIGILNSSLGTLYVLYPQVADARLLVSGTKLMPIGIAVQLIPSLLGLVGIHLWSGLL